MIFIISDSMLGCEWSGVKIYKCRVSKMQNMECVCGRVASGKQEKKEKENRPVGPVGLCCSAQNRKKEKK